MEPGGSSSCNPSDYANPLASQGTNLTNTGKNTKNTKNIKGAEPENNNAAEGAKPEYNNAAYNNKNKNKNKNIESNSKDATDDNDTELDEEFANKIKAGHYRDGRAQRNPNYKGRNYDPDYQEKKRGMTQPTRTIMVENKKEKIQSSTANDKEKADKKGETQPTPITDEPITVRVKTLMKDRFNNKKTWVIKKSKQSIKLQKLTKLLTI